MEDFKIPLRLGNSTGVDFDPIRFAVLTSLVAFLDLALLVFACYIFFKIYRLFQFKDHWLLVSIAFQILAFACILVANINAVVGAYQDSDHFLNSDLGAFVHDQIETLKVLFIFSAFACDVHKWCIFIAASGTSAPDNEFSNEEDIFSKRKRILGRVLILVLVGITLVYVVLSIVRLAADPDSSILESTQ